MGPLSSAKFSTPLGGGWKIFDSPLPR